MTQRQHRIWINREWFIRVDPRGFPLGQYAEGALGAIVQIEHHGPEHERRALKIPRLTADSDRENAYICSLLEEERKVVWKVSAAPQARTAGLMTKRGDHHHALGGSRELANAENPGARHQHRCVILTSFEKDRPPCFASVRLPVPGNRPSNFALQPTDVFPPDLYDELAHVLDAMAVEKLSTDSVSPEHGDIPFYRPAFIRARAHARELHGNLAAAVYPDHDKVWYIALPSIQFPWASGSFQEAAARGFHRTWTIEETYSFLIQLLAGLRNLHSQGYIHGDIRPANILAFGDLRSPVAFYLSDFGSFNTTATVESQGRQETGHTQIGPATANHRSSIFYSAERRAGIERETADVAVILRRDAENEGIGGPDEYLICLGWRNTLLADPTSDGGSSRLNPEVLQDIQDIWEQMRQVELTNQSPEELAPGDRMRIRDLIFTIRGSYHGPAVRERANTDEPHDTYLCYRCDTKYWRVLHEKISVCDLNDDPLPHETLISLAQYTELRMWSAATDLYSVGVLALYTLFVRDEQLTPAQLEEKLALMVETLENVSYFRHFWGYLEGFRVALEEPGDNQHASDVLGIADDAVRRLIATVPHMRRIAEQFSNSADFLLFVHFVLSCMHRQDALSERAGFPCGPFCQTRLEAVTSAATANAYDRLVKLQRSVIRAENEHFGVLDEYADMDPTFGPGAQIEMVDLRAKIARQEATILEQTGLLNQTKTELSDLHAIAAKRDVELEEHGEACRDLERVRTELEEQLVQANAREEGLAADIRQLTADRDEFRKLLALREEEALAARSPTPPDPERSADGSSDHTVDYAMSTSQDQAASAISTGPRPVPQSTTRGAAALAATVGLLAASVATWIVVDARYVDTTVEVDALAQTPSLAEARLTRPADSAEALDASDKAPDDTSGETTNGPPPLDEATQGPSESLSDPTETHGLPASTARPPNGERVETAPSATSNEETPNIEGPPRDKGPPSEAKSQPKQRSRPTARADSQADKSTHSPIEDTAMLNTKNVTSGDICPPSCDVHISFDRNDGDAAYTRCCAEAERNQ